MAKNTAKKRKIPNKQPENNKIVKKKLKVKKIRKTLAVPKKETQILIHDDSDDGETESDKIHNLLEPYTKDQLIDFVVGAAVKDAALFTRIRDAADRDVSHRKIFVYGLGWDTNRETLVSAFVSYGEIEDCNVVTDRVTGKTKGYGFVLFKTRQGAIMSLKQPRKKINNRMTSCQLASLGSVAPPPQSQDTSGRKIYVSNVQFDVDPEKLRAFFAKFGEIETGPLGFDMHTGKSRGFALFVYKTHEGARKALQEPYKIFEGNQLHCQKAAEGKNKVSGPAPAVPKVQPVQAPVMEAMAAAQNLAFFSQNPSLNLMYSGLIANPYAGLFSAGSANPTVAAGGFGQGVIGMSQMGQVSGAGGLLGRAAGLGGYGTTGSHGLGNFCVSPSVLGAYGSSAPTLQGLQGAYPIGQASSAKAPSGAGGSFSGYPS